MKNKEKYKLAFQNIKLNDKVEEKIWTKIKKRKKYLPKYAYALLIIAIMFGSSTLLITNAKEIKQSFLNLTAKFRMYTDDDIKEIDSNNTLMYKKTNFDNFKLPLDESFPEKDYYVYDKYDLNVLDAEEELGFKLLKTNNDNKINYTLTNSTPGSDKVEYVLINNEIYCSTKDIICITYSYQSMVHLISYTLTENANVDNLEWIIKGHIIDEKNIVQKYHINSLNTDGIIYKDIVGDENDNLVDGCYGMAFVYDNSYYYLKVYNLSIEELIANAEALHY